MDVDVDVKWMWLSDVGMLDGRRKEVGGVGICIGIRIRLARVIRIVRSVAGSVLGVVTVSEQQRTS